MLRKKKVVGKFVEFYGAGLSSLSLADRATIGNMAPEYGATMGFFPIDAETIKYLRFTGRDEAQVQLVEAYMQGAGTLPHRRHARSDLQRHPRARSEDRRAESGRTQASAGQSAAQAVEEDVQRSAERRSRAHRHGRGHRGGQAGDEVAASPQLSPSVVATDPDEQAGQNSSVPVEMNGEKFSIRHGSVVIAAITSCTNTSNPSVMLAAGLLARNAVAKGLSTKPWVKTSLAPGSKVVTDYFRKANVMERAARSCASTSLASAARPASATPGRCRSRSPKRWRPTSSSSRRCCRETATSRDASIR